MSILKIRLFLKLKDLSINTKKELETEYSTIFRETSVTFKTTDTNSAISAFHVDQAATENQSNSFTTGSSLSRFTWENHGW